MLGVHFAHRDAERADAVEVLRPVQFKFRVIPLASLFKRHQLVVVPGDCAIELIVGGGDVPLQVASGLIEVLAGALDLLLMFGQLVLDLLPPRVVGLGALRAAMSGCGFGCCGRCAGLSLGGLRRRSCGGCGERGQLQ